MSLGGSDESPLHGRRRPSDALWHLAGPLGVRLLTTLGLDLPDAASDAEQSRALSAATPTIGLGVLWISAGIWLAFSKPKTRA
jgi:hypothetical protein